MESRLQLYNRMLSTRDELKIEDVESLSLEIERRALMMEEVRTARRIGLYYPYANEVRTNFFFETSDKNRKELYYPRMGTDGRLAYYRILHLDTLKPDVEGKLEPTGKESRLRDVNTLNAIIVPGIVFDLSGGRIGFGKGFYDTTLAGYRGVRIALAYDFQVVPKLPVLASAGKRVDWIVTEKRLIKIS
jgi:5-formyltetrahydrofolate cyclo-ligase